MAKKQAKQTQAEQVGLQDVKLHAIKMHLVGDSPLIVHNFSHKAQGEMLAKQCKVTWPKEAKDPALQYAGSLYYIDGNGDAVKCPASLELVASGQVKEFLEQVAEHNQEMINQENPRYGFPSVGFKSCAIRGAKSLGLVMADMKGAFYIPNEYVEINGVPHMRNDMVRIAKATSDIRFRAEFTKWETTFDVVYNSAVVTSDILHNMFHAGGFACGVGEWRPEKGGSMGMFHVESVTE